MKLEKELWKPIPEHLILDFSTVHIWRVELENQARDIDALKQILSVDEKQRVERLLDRDRQNIFIRARAQLRFILGRYLQISPSELHFDYNEQGKPFLAGSGQQLFFNLSHSQSLMVVLVSRHEFCGIDLEWIDPQLKFPAVARQFFTPAENQQLNSYPQYRQRRLFFRIWTRKEATLKALGSGFSSKTEPAAVDLTQWLTCSMPIKKDYLCSFSVKARIDRIERYCVDLL